jgi:hypothetical protein
VTSAATVLTFDGTLDGVAKPWVDYYFQFEAGTAVMINLDCIPNDEENPLDPALRVMGPEGFTVDDDDTGFMECVQANAAQLSFSAPVAGVYTVRASSYEVLRVNDPTDINANGSYRLTLAIDGAFDGPLSSSAVAEMAEETDGWNPTDGRLNVGSLDMAAPVALYQDPVAIYGIDPATGQGVPALTLDPAVVEAVGVPTEANVILAEGVHPVLGTPIIISRLTTGEFQLNAYDANGDPYIVVWDEAGALYHLPG